MRESGAPKWYFAHRGEIDGSLRIYSYDKGDYVLTIAPTTGNIGIGTTGPSSTLHVASGHIQFPFVTAAPISTECDAAAEAGRVVIFSNTATAGDAQLYVCDWNGTTGAWTVK